MKKIQMVLPVLVTVIFSGCYIYNGTLTYEKMSHIQPGMSTIEVIEALGEPFSRCFNEDEEILEFRERMYEQYKVVRVSFVDDRVVQMESFMDKDYGFPKPPTSSTEQKKEDSSDNGTTSGIGESSDGKHYVRAGSIVITPDGKHETIVSDDGAVVITASGEHIHLH